MAKPLLVSALALLLGSGLTSCTLTVADRTNHGLVTSGRNLITNLAPDRGEGASYRVGEEVRLRVEVREPGYLTLLAYQPSGTVEVMARGAYVEAGLHEFPRMDDGVVYNVAEPFGIQKIRAIFSRVQPSTTLVFSGPVGEESWNELGYGDISPRASRDVDVQETYLYIVR
ncbi:DUF4384 domain-containing protein [Deinococcus radiophilus]|uniref:DUF4384 domain-containing protein n=1 Tax=Deinococcus radiophilus TaxID=32062 RepID=A0A3S0RBY7_9DEIO|nr:DUF4384 domain-containing protein [Deinococcus radiophilus]RTR23833.1 DUF4384 domain-containing protein [Deinococcus radiophilus]UFA50451.1 DUF4384 domain-containing protein [Deinococcus radiophilus]